MLTVEMVGDKEVAAAFERLATKTDGRIAKVNERFANILLAKIKQNIIALDIYETGAYHDSWQIIEKPGEGFVVFTDRLDAYRHEHGFVGQDSWGRHYNVMPRPHVRPAQEEIYGDWYRAILMEVLFVWRR